MLLIGSVLVICGHACALQLQQRVSRDLSARAVANTPPNEAFRRAKLFLLSSTWRGMSTWVQAIGIATKMASVTKAMWKRFEILPPHSERGQRRRLSVDVCEWPVLSSSTNIQDITALRLEGKYCGFCPCPKRLYHPATKLPLGVVRPRAPLSRTEHTR